MPQLHLLLLDADAERRRGLAELLRAGGHHVVAVPDAAAASEALSEPGFDLLLLDLELGDLDRSALRTAISSETPAAPSSLDEAERRHIALMLRHTRGNKRQAALLLGIARSTLLHKIRRYGLEAEG
jgi:DNA-binding NtrC family response regulator